VISDLFSTSWKLITITHSSANVLNIYKNGVSIYSGSLTISSRSANNLRIGAGVNEETAKFYLNNGSKIDDFRIYSSILTPEQITVLYTIAAPGSGGGIGSAGASATSSTSTQNGGDGFQVSIRTVDEYFAGGGGANGGTRVPASGHTIGYGGNSTSTTAGSGGNGIVIIRVPSSITPSTFSAANHGGNGIVVIRVAKEMVYNPNGGLPYYNSITGTLIPYAGGGGGYGYNPELIGIKQGGGTYGYGGSSTKGTYIIPPTNKITATLGGSSLSAVLATDNNAYSYYAFTANGSIQFITPTICDILIVGAGGSGSINMGGGSSGGLLYATNKLIYAGTCNITVGAGGVNGDGGNSTAFGATAYGGRKATSVIGATKFSDNLPGNIITVWDKNSSALAGGGYNSSSFFNSITNMIAWYKFDGDTNDSSGNSKHLTLYNNPTPAYDSIIKIKGSSINIDGDTYIRK